MTRPFTGRDMAITLIAFFAVVMAVNFTMARYAIGTFGGTVVDNSYVASQEYNRWLAEARVQQALGWTIDATRGDDGRLRIATGEKGGPLEGATVRVIATHPLGRLPARVITFVGTAGGLHVAREALPRGRWLLRVEVRHGGALAKFDRDLAS